METQYLSFNTNDPIRLDGLTLPGVVTRLEVDGVLELEKKRLEGSSLNVKMARGFHDATVMINLEILPPDTDGQVKLLESAFKKNYASASPKPLRIVNPRLDSRSITSVLFRRLNTVDGNEDEAVIATVEFVEYEVAVGKLEGKSKPATQSGPQALPSGQSGGGGAAGGGSSTPSEAQGGLGRGSSEASTALNIIPNTLGLPSNAPPFLNDITTGGPGAESFIGGNQ